MNKFGNARKYDVIDATVMSLSIDNSYITPLLGHVIVFKKLVVGNI